MTAKPKTPEAVGQIVVDAVIDAIRVHASGLLETHRAMSIATDVGMKVKLAMKGEDHE